jgi:hypothetical protein
MLTSSRIRHHTTKTRAAFRYGLYKNKKRRLYMNLIIINGVLGEFCLQTAFYCAFTAAACNHHMVMSPRAAQQGFKVYPSDFLCVPTVQHCLCHKNFRTVPFFNLSLHKCGAVSFSNTAANGL